jgi:hypothetical protein
MTEAQCQGAITEMDDVDMAEVLDQFIKSGEAVDMELRGQGKQAAKEFVPTMTPRQIARVIKANEECQSCGLGVRVPTSGS